MRVHRRRRRRLLLLLFPELQLHGDAYVCPVASDSAQIEAGAARKRMPLAAPRSVGDLRVHICARSRPCSRSSSGLGVRIDRVDRGLEFAAGHLFGGREFIQFALTFCFPAAAARETAQLISSAATPPPITRSCASRCSSARCCAAAAGQASEQVNP